MDEVISGEKLFEVRDYIYIMKITIQKIELGLIWDKRSWSRSALNNQGKL